MVNKQQERCFVCGKKPLSHNEIGLNKKIFGRRITKYYCIDCISENFEVTTEEMYDKIEEFKDQGCALFQ